ncbi:MAG: hypothetical protein OXU73_02060, partial [Candidatus Campbellbacteria bacterium]|nr:hypothetical protein [Candidatus Campbellbacteria bacterium]
FDLKEIKSFDILVEIRKVLGRRIKLDWVADGTLGIKKSGTGREAVEWYKSGEIEKLREYCLKDVKITKDIFDILYETGVLKYKDLNVNHEIKFDINWEQIEPRIKSARLF